MPVWHITGQPSRQRSSKSSAAYEAQEATGLGTFGTTCKAAHQNLLLLVTTKNSVADVHLCAALQADIQLQHLHVAGCHASIAKQHLVQTLIEPTYRGSLHVESTDACAAAAAADPWTVVDSCKFMLSGAALSLLGKKHPPNTAQSHAYEHASHPLPC
jgi:hypothetical protein